jgi:hypothetical protein
MGAPFREDLTAEAEAYPLLEAVAREQLLKTEHDGKDLLCAVVICKAWKFATAL